MTIRCTWPSSELDIAYHDQEWGVPVHDDRVLFEFLIDPQKVARFTAARKKLLMKDQGIVRNRLKIDSTVTNAHAFLAVQQQFGSFDRYVWQFVGGSPRQNARTGRDIPARTAESDALSKDLRQRGFRFVGSTICYAFMQATGMVNDHLVGCYRYRQVATD